MAQTGYTPILIYSSTTASQAPLPGNLTNSTLGSELAINITDGKLFYKDNANAVQVIGWKVVPATAGGTGQTSYAVGDILYASSTTALSKLADVATGNALISGGVNTAPSWGKIGLTTHISGTLPIANGGTNQTAFTSPSSSIAGLVWFDGTSFQNDTTTSHVGYNATTNTFYANNVNFGGTVTLASALPTTQGGTGLASFTTNGILYATSTSALTTGSALTFDGSLVVPQSAIGTNGTVGFRANDTTNSKNIQMFRAGSGYNYLGIVGTQGVIYSIDKLTIAMDTNGPLQLSLGGAVRWTYDSTGNVAVNTAAKGINFTANSAAAGMTSQLLNAYEEGNWTPVVTASSGTITSYTINAATYVRIGSSVTAFFDFTITNNGTGAGVINVSLPITTPIVSAFGVARETVVTGAAIMVALYSGQAIFLETMAAGAYPGGTNYRIRGSITYRV